MAANSTYDKIRTLYTNLKRDTFDIVKSPSEVFEYLMRNIVSINSSITEALANVKFGGDAGHYVTHEFMPSSAENRRSQIEDKPQSTFTLDGASADTKLERQKDYAKYGQFYAKYKEALKELLYKAKLNAGKIYRDLTEQPEAGKKVYEASVSVPRKTYNIFKTAKLAERVAQLSSYLKNNAGIYRIVRSPTYEKIRNRTSYSRRSGLEEILATA